MIDWISNLLSSKDASLQLILACFLALNVGLTGLKKGLDLIKDKTEAKWDNDMSDLIGKILGSAGKGIEFLSANESALPVKTRADLDAYIAEQVKAHLAAAQGDSKAPPA